MVIVVAFMVSLNVAVIGLLATTLIALIAGMVEITSGHTPVVS